jgi:hypothetical protein
VIGSGLTEHLQEVRQATGYQGTLLSDSSRKSFAVLGLKRGLGGLLGLGPLQKGFAALRAGHRPGRLQGDALQQGGAVVIRPDNSVAYLYRSSEAGEHPAVDALLAAAES